MYFMHSIAPISAMILVYILIERFLSIKYPVESNLLRKKSIQMVYLLVTVVFNLLYYLTVPFFYEIVTYNTSGNNGTNGTYDTGCYFASPSKKRIISNLVFLHKIFLPFGLMIIFSALLIHSIFKSKSRVLTLYSKREITIFQKDIQLSIMSILINIIFISLNLPFAIVLYFFDDYSDFLFLVTLNIFYLSYAFNFYLFLTLNSMFRNEFVHCFKSESSSISNYESVNASL